MAVWRNWQTRKTEDLVSERACGFKSLHCYMIGLIDWFFGHSRKEDYSPEGADDRVYQKKNGVMYIKSSEFVRSEEGQKLIKRFNENVEVGDVVRE